MNTTQRLKSAGWLVAAGLIGAALIAPSASLAADPVYATVTGYAEHSPANNDASTWGSDCSKLATPEGGWGDTYVLPAGYTYRLVIVKAGSDESTLHPNTKFGNPLAGQTVWADSDGSGTPTEADKNISHIIICGAQTTTTTTSTIDTETTDTSTTSTATTTTATTTTATTSTATTTTATTSTATTTTATIDTVTTDTTSSGSEAEEAPTPPLTDTLNAPAGGSNDSWRFLLLAAAGILGGALLLTPSVLRKR